MVLLIRNNGPLRNSIYFNNTSTAAANNDYYSSNSNNISNNSTIASVVAGTIGGCSVGSSGVVGGGGLIAIANGEQQGLICLLCSQPLTLTYLNSHSLLCVSCTRWINYSNNINRQVSLLQREEHWRQRNTFWTNQLIQR